MISTLQPRASFLPPQTLPILPNQTRFSRGSLNLIEGATWTLCDSCGCYYDADGNEQIEQPHRNDVNSEAGTCPSCVATLTRLKVPIFQNFYRSTPPEMAAQGMAATVDEGTARKSVYVNAGKQFPIALINRDSRKDGNFLIKPAVQSANFTTVLKAA